MVQKVLTIKNPSGIHARPAMMLVQKASSFPCEVTIIKGDKYIDAKSIMGVISLGMRRGEQITVTAEGQQQAEALKAIEEVIESIKE